jgi:hypothetical protein
MYLLLTHALYLVINSAYYINCKSWCAHLNVDQLFHSSSSSSPPPSPPQWPRARAMTTADTYDIRVQYNATCIRLSGARSHQILFAGYRDGTLSKVVCYDINTDYIA